jgi:PD-(D/E)XK nuclease superfamily protein
MAGGNAVKKKGTGLFYQRSMHRSNDGPLQGAPRMKIALVPTPDNPMIVSISEMQSFLRCRLKWNWERKLGLRSRKAGGPRVNGILVHAGKEGFYGLVRKERTPKAMKRAAKIAFDKVKEVPVTRKDRDLAAAMLAGYAEWVTGDHDLSDRAIGKKKVWPEWEFVIPLVKDKSILIRGKIDELFEPTIYKGVLAMDETKTKNNIGFEMMDLDSQLTTYLWAMWRTYPKYDRYIAWRTVLRRQMPGPRVKAPLFGRESIERTPEDLLLWEKDARRIIMDMLDAAIYPHKNESCRWSCDFYELCLARGNKADLKAIINEQFDREET